MPQIEALRTKHRTVRRPCDARSLEEGVRQRLADKVSGTMVGLWLLIGEHLRLGTWDLLSGWTGPGVSPAAPRVAMQMVHEAALCVSGIRERRSLTAHDFELLNGLPFVASDGAVHDLLNAHTIDQAQAVQVALGRIRQSRGHFPGALLAIDPHRLPSTSKRHMRRHKTHAQEIARKAMQTFFCLDAVTAQPLCLTSGSSARTVAQATPELLDLAAAILGPKARGVLVLADTEHFTGELLDAVHQQTPFDLLTPMPRQRDLEQRAADLPPEAFGRCWAGLAMAKRPYTPVHSKAGPYWMIVQRSGEDPRQWHYKSFLCTSDRPEVDLLTRDFPQRWHIEEFFNVNQALGWQHAGTQNLHIRYGRMTMALMAQAALHQLRQRLGPAQQTWNAQQFATKVLRGLDGDVRVEGDRIVVTYYNAKEILPYREQFEDLPARLSQEKVDPRIPWLYGYRLDFQFR